MMDFSQVKRGNFWFSPWKMLPQLYLNTLLQADMKSDDKVATAAFACSYVHTCRWILAPAKMLTQAFQCNFSLTAAKLSHMFIESRKRSVGLWEFKTTSAQWLTKPPTGGKDGNKGGDKICIWPQTKGNLQKGLVAQDAFLLLATGEPLHDIS